MNPQKTDSEYLTEAGYGYDLYHIVKLLRARDERNQLRAENDALKAELASLKTVAKAAEAEHSRTGDDFHTGNKIVEHGYFNDLSQALSDHAAKGYKLE